MALARLQPFAADVLDVLATRHRWTRNFFERLYWESP
jgi:hypothetical protein